MVGAAGQGAPLRRRPSVWYEARAAEATPARLQFMYRWALKRAGAEAAVTRLHIVYHATEDDELLAFTAHLALRGCPEARRLQWSCADAGR